MSAGNVLGSAVLELRTDDSNLSSGIDKAKGAAEGLTGSFEKISGGAQKVGAAMSVVSAAAIGAAVVSTAEFVNFQSQMNETFTLIPGVTQSAMADMTGSVKGFATEFGVLPNEVVPALYQSLSAGIPAGNVFEFLETAQKAAVGGVTDLTTAVDGISSVINAYGQDVLSAGEASDLMFTAVRLGKTTFDELSSSLFQVNPIASALGIEFGNVTAALATMTAQGVPTGVATTQLRQLFVELSKEGSATSDVFKEIAGVGFKEFIASGGNVQGALQLLEQHAADSGVSINDLFGSVEAGSAALALTGGNTESFTASLAAMDESAGATDAAYATMTSGIGHSIDKLKAQFAVLRLEVGEALAPLAERVINSLTGIVSFISGTLLPAFQGLPGPVQAAIAVIAGIGLAIGPVVLVLGTLGVAVAGIAAAIAPMSAAFAVVLPIIAGLAAPVLAVVAAGVALAAVGILIYKNWDTVKNAFSVVAEAIPEVGMAFDLLRDAGSQLVSHLRESFEQLGEHVRWTKDVIAGSLDDIGLIFTGLGNMILGQMEISIAAIMGLVNTIISSAKGIGLALKGDFTGALNELSGGIGDAMGDMAQRIEEGAERSVRGAQQIADGINGVAQEVQKNRDNLSLDLVGRINEVTAYAQGLSDLAEQHRQQAQAANEAATSEFNVAEAQGLSAVASGRMTQSREQELAIMSDLESGLGAYTGQLTESARAADEAGIAAWKFQEYLRDIGIAAEETVNGLGNFGVMQDIFQANIANASAGVSEWQGHLSGAEKALGFLQAKIDEGIPLTEAEAANYDTLTGAVQRYTGGIQDESVALIEGEVAKANFIALQDELNAKLADGRVSQDEYNQAIAGAAASLDPATSASMGLTDAQSKLADVVGGVVDKIRDLLVDLGILDGATAQPQVTVPGAIEAKDAVAGVNDQLNLFPPSKESAISVQIGTALDTAREMVSTLGAIPPSTVSDITSNVGEVTPQIANHGGILEGLPGETPTMITTNATEASGEINGVSQTIDEVPKSTLLAFEAATGGAITDTQNLTSTINDVPKENTSSFIADVQGAIGGTQELTRNIDAVPDSHSTTLSAVDHASGPIGSVQGALNGLPTSFTVYIDANAAGFYAAVAGVDAYIPRSPAKEGPFSKPANWGWIFQGLAPAAQSATNDMGRRLEGVDLNGVGQRQMQSWATGIIAGSGNVTSAAGDVAGDVNTAVVESLGGGRQFQADTFLSDLSAFSEFILNTVIESATQFEDELITAAKTYTDAVKSSTDMFTAAMGLMELLGESNPNAASARTAIEELNLFTRHIIESVAASAELVGGAGEDGLLARTQEYATGAQAGVDLLASGAELFATLADLKGDLDTAKQAASDIKFLTEHITLSVGDSAGLVSATRTDGFTTQASAYAENAMAGVELMAAGATAMTALSEMTGNLDRAKTAATDVKFLTEHIVLSIGDSAAFVAAERGDGFVAQAGIYAEAALTAVELINAAATTMAELELVTIDLDRAKEAASQMKFLTEHIVQSIGDSAALFTAEGLTHIQVYADAALAGQEIMQGVAPTLDSMLAFGALDTSGVDLQLRAMEMADLTRLIVTELQNVATHFQAEGLGAVTQFSEAATSAMDVMGQAGAALEGILTFGSIETDGYQLATLANDIVHFIEMIVIELQLVAIHFETAGLDAVTQFSDAALKGLEVMGAAGDALAAILMFGALTPAERDGLKGLAFEMTGVMDYVIAMIRDMANQYSTEGIEHLSAFATAARQSLDLVGAAETAFKGMVDHSRVTQEHADAFLASWTIVIELVKDVADLVSSQGVQDALRFLQAAEEVAALMTAANNAINSVAPQPLPSTGSSGAKTTDLAPVTSPSAGATTGNGTGKGAFEKVYGMTKAEYFAQPGMAVGGVTDRETLVRISEGNKREGVIPLENGGAGIVAKALVDQMRQSPEWAAMTGGSLPSSAAMNPWSTRQAISDIDINFNAPVTINARDRADAERSLGDVAWGLKAAQRKRGIPA